MPKTKIDAPLLQRRLTAMKDFYKTRNLNMLGWRDLFFRTKESYFLDNEGVHIEQEEDETRIILPIIQTTVESFMELLLTTPPAITVPLPSDKGEHVIHADHNEKVLLSIWQAANIYEELVDSLWHGFVDGWGVLQILWDKTPEEEQSPVVIISQDPINIYACPGNRPGTWRYVIHSYPILVSEVKEKFMSRMNKVRLRYKALEKALEDMEDTDTVTFIDYWDDEVNAISISLTKKESGSSKGSTHIDELLKDPTPHRYGFLPFEIYHPNRLPFRRVGERLGVSLFHIIAETVVYFMSLISRKATMLDRWSDPPLVTQTDAGIDFEPVRMGAGYHLPLGLDEKAYYLENPTPQPQLDSMIEMVLDFIERASLPRVLQGQYVGTMSGIAMSLLRNPTLMKIAFKQKTLERALVSMNSKILRLLETKLRSARYMWGFDNRGRGIDVMMDPKKIKGYYRNEVKLSASLPTDDANIVSMLASMVQLGIISTQTARDVMQQVLHQLLPPSLPDEQKRVLSEKILNDPEMIRQLALKAAKETLGELIGLEPEGDGQAQTNPMGGRGPSAIQLPAGARASQLPGMPGGNVDGGGGGPPGIGPVGPPIQ